MDERTILRVFYHRLRMRDVRSGILNGRHLRDRCRWPDLFIKLSFDTAETFFHAKKNELFVPVCFANEKKKLDSVNCRADIPIESHRSSSNMALAHTHIHTRTDSR